MSCLSVVSLCVSLTVPDTEHLSHGLGHLEECLFKSLSNEKAVTRSVPPTHPRQAGWPAPHSVGPGRRGSCCPLSVNSPIQIPPNTRPLPTAPTPAARRAPTPPTGASCPSKAWSSRPTMPDATAGQGAGRGPDASAKTERTLQCCPGKRSWCVHTEMKKIFIVT